MRKLWLYGSFGLFLLATGVAAMFLGWYMSQKTINWELARELAKTKDTLIYERQTAYQDSWKECPTTTAEMIEPNYYQTDYSVYEPATVTPEVMPKKCSDWAFDTCIKWSN